MEKIKLSAVLVGALGIIFLAGCSERSTEPRISPPSEPITQGSGAEKSSSWQYGGAVISGQFADADVVEIGNGKFRMYYSAEPEMVGFRGQVYSAVSSDGISWTKEDGIRIEWATFPSVIKLSDGKYRMYYQNQETIKSAVSADGLAWQEEPGVRIDKSNSIGLDLENVAAPTVVKNGNDYLMAYRGTLGERFSKEVPNNDTQLFLWAVSKDGLAFEKKGLALDSRNSEFKGLLDGPEFMEADDTVRLYFWSYGGVYHVDFKNGAFSQTAQFDYTTLNPPCDPALVKIGEKRFMYYGQHGKGIYYAVK